MNAHIAKCRLLALLGTLLMGVGCGLACLADAPAVSNAGSVLLLVSIGVMTYGFYYWRP